MAIISFLFFSTLCSLDEDTFFHINLSMHICVNAHLIPFAPSLPGVIPTFSSTPWPPDLVGFVSICEESPRARQ